MKLLTIRTHIMKCVCVVTYDDLSPTVHVIRTPSKSRATFSMTGSATGREQQVHKLSMKNRYKDEWSVQFITMYILCLYYNEIKTMLNKLNNSLTQHLYRYYK